MGGSAVPSGGLPSAALVVQQQLDGSSSVCSGTVVATNVVLTAAHCTFVPDTLVPAPASSLAVVIGQEDVSTIVPANVYGVSRVFAHPAYSRTYGWYDAGLLVLSRTTSAPAMALAGSTDQALLAAGTPALIAGWGRTDGTAADISHQLLAATTVVQSDSVCAAAVQRLYGAYWNASAQICAIDPPAFETGTCSGDSGGPLAVRRPDATWVEIGITSRGPTDCATTAPDVYTQVSAISGWVDAVVRAVAPPAPVPSTPAPSAPAPAPAAAAPVPSPAAARPAPAAATPGLYRGTTVQREQIALRVASAAPRLVALTFAYRLRCANRAGPLYYSFAPLTSRSRPWPLTDSGGRAFSRSFSDSTGVRYQLLGSFSGRRVSGTLRAVWRTRRYGRCDTGVVRYTATRR